MEQYPSIPGSSDRHELNRVNGKPCIGFYKYDGSNLRWEWSPKKGWNKYGTRRQLFDKSTELYNQAIPIFMDTMADEIVYRTKQFDQKVQRITAFTEFFGPTSFAGQHVLEEPKTLVLFDVYLFKHGLLDPWKFVKHYGSMKHAAKVLYEGPFTRELALEAYQGKFEAFEGVIFKGEDFMIKSKTQRYYDECRLRRLLPD